MDVFRKDLHLDARSPWTYVIRIGFVSALFAFVWFSWFNLAGELKNVQRDPEGLGRDIFMYFAIAEMVLLLLLAPAMAVGMFIQEKASGAMEVLAITTLSVRELVFKKFLAKSTVILMVAASGLPVTALALYYGGLAPEQAFVIFLLFCSLSLCIVAIAAHCSIQLDKVIPALIRTYIYILIYLMFLPALFVVTFFLSPILSFFYILSEGHTGSVVMGLFSCAYTLMMALIILNRAVKKLRQREVYLVKRSDSATEALIGSFADAGKNLMPWLRSRAWQEKPILWLDSLRATNGALFFWVVVIAILGIGIMILTWLSGGSDREYRQFVLGVAHFMVYVAVFVALISAATSVSNHRENRALDLLVMSSLRPSQLVFGTLVTSSVVVLPLLALSSLLRFTVPAASVGAILYPLSIYIFVFFTICFSLYVSLWSRTNTQALFLTFLLFIAVLALPVSAANLGGLEGSLGEFLNASGFAFAFSGLETPEAFLWASLYLAASLILLTLSVQTFERVALR